MRLNKSTDSARTPVACTPPRLSNSLDTSMELTKAGWFWIQTTPSPLQNMMMKTFVVTSTGQNQAMTPQTKNHNKGTQLSTQGDLFYGFLGYRRSLPYLLQRPSMY